jgi:arginine utilization protein RocB
MNVIAPPPAAVNTLEALIELVRNPEQTAKLVKDLKSAAKANEEAAAALAEANAEGVARVEKLEKLEASITAKTEKHEAARAKAEVAAATAQETQQSAARSMAQLDAKVAQIEQELADRKIELDNLALKLQSELVLAETAKDEALKMKALHEEKLAQLRAAVV